MLPHILFSTVGAARKFPGDKQGNTTVVISDSLFSRHHIAPDHPESPERLRHIDLVLNASATGLNLTKTRLVIRDPDWLRRAHSSFHIKSIADKWPTAHKVAHAAVSAALQAVDLVCNEQADNVFCSTRPPGHHALNTGKEEGFCYYNQIAIAALYAREIYKLRRILIVDWDYHHGNSTEALFYEDPDVLFFSTHDQLAYPGTGDPRKTGSGAGKGFNINVHLDCGAGDSEVLDAFRNKLIPAAEQFVPELVLISAGFDSRSDDLLGCFNFTDDGFSQLTKIVMDIANKHCGGKIVSVLEGGYNLHGNALGVKSHVKTLANYSV